MNIIRALIILIISYFGISNYYLRNKVNELDTELGIAKTNVIAYENIANGVSKQNATLQLTIEDFKQSNDSVIKELNNTKAKLKIKDKQLDQAISVNTVLIDTLKGKVPELERDFTVELKSNQLTTINVSRVGEDIMAIPIIYNRQDLLIVEDKVWRNKRKNFFQRLVHFDFKKDKIETYQILNSNDKIQVLDTRIIKITK